MQTLDSDDPIAFRPSDEGDFVAELPFFVRLAF